MKVFQINTVYNSGSTGRIAAQLKHAVEAMGGECIAAYGRGHSDEKNTLKIGSATDMYYHTLMTRLTDRTAFYSTKSTLKLCDKIKEFAPDVIHLHNLHGYYLNIEILFDFLKSFRRPVIWTLHDCWAFTGHCAYFTASGCTQWKSHCAKCIEKSQYPASKVKDNSYENFDRKKKAFQGLSNLNIVTPSNWLADLVKESFLADYPVKVVYNGIDTEQFHPTPSEFRVNNGVENKILLLGAASVWNRRKGFDDFLKLAADLDDRYRIVLVGLNRRQIQTLPSNIIGLEHTDTVEYLAGLYSTADLYLNLSTEETFGLTVVEAIACGTMPIVYEGTACEEIVRLSTGIVVPRDMTALKKTLVDLEFGQRPEAVETYAKTFSNERFVGEMLNIYKGCLK